MKKPVRPHLPPQPIEPDKKHIHTVKLDNFEASKLNTLADIVITIQQKVRKYIRKNKTKYNFEDIISDNISAKDIFIVDDYGPSYDGFVMGFGVDIVSNNPSYKEELERYEKDLRKWYEQKQKYQDELKKYNKNIRKYNAKQKQIKELKQQLRKLESE